MELLADSYASSSSDDEVGRRPGDVASSQPAAQPSVYHAADLPAIPTDSKSTNAQQNPLPTDAVRAAIARRFAARAATATHSATPQEHSFAYKPYESKRRPRVAPQTKLLSHLQSYPLFAELRASSQPLRNHSSGAKIKATAAIPHLQRSVHFTGHTGPVYYLDWNPRYPPLFMSASMDHSVRVWSLPRTYYDESTVGELQAHGHSALDENSCRRVLVHHAQGVKSAKWSLHGQHLWSGGYDGRAAYVDVESSSVLQLYHHRDNENVTSVCIHPRDPQLALFGTDRGRIVLRDLRSEATVVAATYGTKTTGEVHDMLFLPSDPGDGLKFVSSSALTARDMIHQSLVVWDLRSSAIISDHLNNDLCAFTSLRLHPNNKTFVAQSTESEGVYFSAQAPYKRLKPKKSFVKGHDVEGFSVGCSFNATGSLFATGDINGRVVFYCARTQRLLRQSQVYNSKTPILSVDFHPRWPSSLLCGGYDGRIWLFDTVCSPAFDSTCSRQLEVASQGDQTSFKNEDRRV